MDTLGNGGHDCSIALDFNGNPHISYQAGNQSGLKYASRNGSNWKIETVDPGKFGFADSMISVGWYSSLELDSNDNPHISYYDAANGNLRYASSPNATGFPPQPKPSPSPSQASAPTTTPLSEESATTSTSPSLTPSPTPLSSSSPTTTPEPQQSESSPITLAAASMASVSIVGVSLIVCFKKRHH